MASWSLFTIAAKPLLQRHRALTITYAASLITLVTLAPLAQIEAHGMTALASAPLQSLLWVVALGVLVSFGSTLLWIEAVRLVKPVMVAAFVFIQPIVGALLGHLVFGESLSGPGLLGGALICGAVLLVASGEGTRAAAEPT
ncbi:MAG: DMT family transporter [Planctomycetota bacterium]